MGLASAFTGDGVTATAFGWWQTSVSYYLFIDIFHANPSWVALLFVIIQTQNTCKTKIYGMSYKF
jgi:hypothetical protein